MPRYLLDTNAVSELIRNPQGVVRRAVDRAGVHTICTSIIAAAELRYGAAKKGSRRLIAKVDALLEVIEVRPFDVPADRIYGELRAELERKGRPISPHDLLIAAHALTLGCTLVTSNEREFTRISKLRVENWLTGERPH